MSSPYAKGTPSASLSTVTRLDALDIDIEKIATAHTC